MVICLERGADLHMAQLMPLPLTVSCFSKIQIGFTFLAPAHQGSPGKGPLNVCVCVRACVCNNEMSYSYQLFINKDTNTNKEATERRLHPRFATAGTVYNDNVNMCEYSGCQDSVISEFRTEFS